MKTQQKPSKTSRTKKSGNQQQSNTESGNPKKPNYDPDQTPKREIEQEPSANPDQHND